MTKRSIPNFLDVFQKRVDKARDRVKEELAKEKSQRDRKLLKEVLKDVKDIRRAIKSAREEHANRCPNCGYKL